MVSILELKMYLKLEVTYLTLRFYKRRGARGTDELSLLTKRNKRKKLGKYHEW